MPLELVTVPCLDDNYAFIIADPAKGAAAVVDVPEAGPINAAVKARGWTVTNVLLTHHHWDHIDGLPDLERATSARIIGAKADAHRLPPLDIAVSDGETFKLGGEDVQVFDVSGHTVGHVAYYLPASRLLFSGDSLMALGCGRLFEGTPAQMWESLQKLRALPPETEVCSGHEYTSANGKFAATLEPDNPRLISRIDAVATAREKGEATVPSKLEEELATNPFLRSDVASFQEAVGMQGADPAEVFKEIRSRKDNF